MINPQRGPLLKPSEGNGRRASRQMSTIVDKKESRFDHLKRVVRSGLQTAFEVGAALLEIRDQKLYQKEFESFEAFCESEFQIVRRRAYQLIDAAQVKASLPAELSTMVHNERQARAIGKVPEAKRVEVLTEAAKAPGPVTAKRITEAAKAKPTTIEARAIHLDKTGIAIPDSVLEDWKRAEAFSSVLQSVSKIKCMVEEGLKEKDFVLYAEVSNTTVATLKNAYGDLAQVIPYAVCSTCQGHERKKCVLCKGRGFLSKFRYENCVPKKTRDVRERAAQK